MSTSEAELILQGLSPHVRSAWDRFVEESSPSAPYIEGGRVVLPSRPWLFDIPIVWGPFYDFVIAVHEQGEILTTRAISVLLTSGGMSEGPAEDVAWSYQVAREVLARYDSRGS